MAARRRSPGRHRPDAGRPDAGRPGRRVAPFPGYSPAALRWWRGLARQAGATPADARRWFRARRDVFAAEVKGPTEALAAWVAARLAAFAPEHVPADPAACVLRIHRDLRFRPDGAPYKPHLKAWFGRHGEGPATCAGYAFAVSARGVEVLGGTYAPDGAHLRRLRAWLLVEHGSLRRLLRRRSVRETFGALEGSSLVGMPRGLPPDADGRPVTAAHPAADLLRRTQFVLRARVPAAQLPTRALGPAIVAHLRRLHPFVARLQEGLDAPLQA